jgi:hypothetical protein
MVETLAELPFAGDQVGLFRPQPGRSNGGFGEIASSSTTCVSQFTLRRDFLNPFFQRRGHLTQALTGQSREMALMENSRHC